MTIGNVTTLHKKQQIWRRKQIKILYGSGRPIFNISEQNHFYRENYDCVHYFDKYGCRYLDNKNFIPDKTTKRQNDK